MKQLRSVPKLGFWILTALVAGNMIGSGVFLLPSSLADFGSIGIVAWIFTAIGAIFIALVFAKLSKIVPKVGGPYAYCREGFGNCVGFLVAYNYWISMWVGNAAIMVAFIGYLSVFWPELDTNHLLAFGISMVVLWSVTIINILGLRKAGILQVVTTILKIIPLILVAVVGVFYIHPHHYAAFNVSGKPALEALSAAASLTLWSFIGLESATVPADSVADPEKTISKATIAGTLIAALIYILSTIAIMGMVPLSQLANSAAPYALAAKIIFGPVGGGLVALGAIIACFGALNGWTLLAGQVPMAAARDKIFPKSFAKLSKNGTPYFGLVVSSLLVSALLLLTLNVALVQQFTLIVLLATLASLIPYFFTAMAEFMLLFRHKDKFSPKRLGSSLIITAIAGLYSFWAIAGSGQEIVYFGLLLMLSGLPVYVWVRWRIFSQKEAQKVVQAALKGM